MLGGLQLGAVGRLEDEPETFGTSKFCGPCQPAWSS
jgi:hypothetical protein